MGATIRALRGDARLSQVALGARIGMHHNYLGAIERGDVPNPGLERVERIAHGLGVSIAVLAQSFAAPPADAALRLDASGGRTGAEGRGGGGAGVGVADAGALGMAIRLVRRHHGLTQAQLADAAALHRAHLGSIEAGEKPNPGIGTIARIAHGLDGAGEGEAEMAHGPLLPLLAQTFNGELTVTDLRSVLAAKPSGPPGARPVPQRGAGTPPGSDESGARASGNTRAPPRRGRRLRGPLG